MRSTLLGLSCILPPWGSADAAESAAQPIDRLGGHYLAEIKPLLQPNAWPATGSEAGSRPALIRVFMQQGGDSGSILEAGEASLLLERVTADEDQHAPTARGSARCGPTIAKRGWLLGARPRRRFRHRAR